MIKEKQVAAFRHELNYELRLNAVSAIDGVTHTMIVSYGGDYMNEKDAQT